MTKRIPGERRHARAAESEPDMHTALVAGSNEQHHGVTLVELLVLLGIMAGVAGLTLATARPVATVDPVVARIAAARDSAVRFGRAVTVQLSAVPRFEEATALPDGRVIADSALAVDPLSGVPDATSGSP